MPRRTQTHGEGASIESISDTAAILFKGTQPVHALRPRALRALEAAARLGGIDPYAQTAAATGRPDIPEDLPRHLGRTVANIWDVLAPPADGEARLASLQPAHRVEAQVLAALMQAAQAMVGPMEQETRLDTIRVRPTSVMVSLSGPGARSAAHRMEQGCSLWRQAIGRRLIAEIGPATDDDLAVMAAGPVGENGPLARALQRILAQEFLKWQATWGDCQGSQPEAPAAMFVATVRTSQLLAALRPVLMRRPTKRLRAELAKLHRRLGVAGRARATQEDVTAYAGSQPPAAALHLAALAQTASEAAQATSATIANWANSSPAAATALRLRTFISDLPLRRKHEATTLAEAAPPLLLEAAEHLARRQAAFSAADPASWHRTAFAVVRLQVAVATLGEANQASTHVIDLLRDLDRAAHHLDTLIRLEAVERAVVTYLDGWAERQGRRKAPQLHGAEAVLEYRQQRRSERVRELRALAEAWKPLRGRRLRRRAAAVWSGTLA